MLSEEAFNQELAHEANRIAGGRAAFRPLARGVEVTCEGLRSHLDTRELYRAYAEGEPERDVIGEFARTLVAQSEGIAEVVDHAADFEFARTHLYPQFLPEGMTSVEGAGRTWVQGLEVGYVLDSDDWWQLVVVTGAMRQSWHIDEGALFDLALGNLAAVAAPPTCLVPGRAYAFMGGERPHLSAVQVLLPEQMRHLADLCEEGRLRVEVPFRGYAAAYADGDEAARRGVRRSLAVAARRHAYRLSRLAYRWEQGRWSADGDGLAP